MSEGRHTPGPWRVQYTTNVRAAHRAVANCASYSSNGPDQMDIIFENRANARLIAAAPDLLAACEAAYHALRSYQYGNSATELAEGVADEIAAVIAKARGTTDETH